MGMIIIFIVYQLSKEISRVVKVDPKISLWRARVGQCRRVTARNGRAKYTLEYVETFPSNQTLELDVNVDKVWHYFSFFTSLVRGRPEMSTLSAYEIPSHKRGGRGFVKTLKSHNFLKLYFMFTICLW